MWGVWICHRRSYVLATVLPLRQSLRASRECDRICMLSDVYWILSPCNYAMCNLFKHIWATTILLSLLQGHAVWELYCTKWSAGARTAGLEWCQCALVGISVCWCEPVLPFCIFDIWLLWYPDRHGNGGCCCFRTRWLRGWAMQCQKDRSQQSAIQGCSMNDSSGHSLLSATKIFC